MTINNHQRVKIEKVGSAVAQVSLVDAQLQEIPIPGNVRMELSDGSPNLVVINSNFITWTDDYTLFVDDQPFIELQNKKEQSISAPEDVKTWSTTA